jgi:hypothetical protein
MEKEAQTTTTFTSVCFSAFLSFVGVPLPLTASQLRGPAFYTNNIQVSLAGNAFIDRIMSVHYIPPSFLDLLSKITVQRERLLFSMVFDKSFHLVGAELACD